MIKNPTPRGIVFRTTIAISLLVLAVLLASLWIGWIQFQHILMPFALTVFVFLAAYFIQYNALERFIYRKIKVIYKNIHDLKRTRDEKLTGVDLDRDIISEVNQEVMEWAEDKSREIAQLKSSADYRKEFLGNVSHELKTPLFSVQGYIETLLDGGIDDPRINKEYLYKASSNVERLINIVSDLENISLLESGRLELHSTNFDLRELVQEVMESLEIYADVADIDLGFKDGTMSRPMVFADRERIRQVLINLFSNAIRYGREAGHARVGFYDMNENVLVEITDNGQGIPQENLSRVFERFFRTDKARSREKGGTGLGLSIVKHIIEAHNQTIHVRSTEGLGSTFGFTLKKGSVRR